MAYITVGSTFTPFTYEEKVRPFIQYNEAYNDIEDKYLTMQERAAQVGALIDPTISPEAYKIYQNYQNAIQTAFDDLYGNGLTNTNRAMFSNIRKEQVPALTALTSDIARSEKAKEAFDKVWYGKEHDFIGRNPHNTSLDEWLGGKTPNTKGLSSSELSAYVAAGTKAASDRAYQTYQKNGYMVTKTGLDQSEVDSLMYALNTGKRFDDSTHEGKYLNKVLDDVIEFLDTDVYSRFGLNAEDEFTQQNLNEINAAINYGLRIGFTHDQKVTPISTGRGGNGGGSDDGGIPNGGTNIIPAVPLNSPRKNQETRNMLATLSNYSGSVTLSDGTTISDPIQAYDKLQELYNSSDRRGNNVDSGRGFTWLSAAFSQPTSVDKDIEKLQAFIPEEIESGIKSIRDQFGASNITDINSVRKLQEDFTNRTIAMPSQTLITLSVNNDLKGAITGNLMDNFNIKHDGYKTNDKTSIYKLDGYARSNDRLTYGQVKEYFGDNGSGINSITVTPYSVLNNEPFCNVNTDQGTFAVPLLYILGDEQSLALFIKKCQQGFTTGDIDKFNTWFGTDKQKTTLIQNNITDALKGIRGEYNTAYSTVSASKSNRR